MLKIKINFKKENAILASIIQDLFDWSGILCISRPFLNDIKDKINPNIGNLPKYIEKANTLKYDYYININPNINENNNPDFKVNDVIEDANNSCIIKNIDNNSKKKLYSYIDQIIDLLGKSIKSTCYSDLKFIWNTIKENNLYTTINIFKNIPKIDDTHVKKLKSNLYNAWDITYKYMNENEIKQGENNHLCLQYFLLKIIYEYFLYSETYHYFIDDNSVIEWLLKPLYNFKYKNGIFYNLYGRVYDNIKHDCNKAYIQYTEGVKIDQLPESYFLKGYYFHYFADDQPTSISYCNQALAKTNEPKYWNLLGMSYERSKNHSLAMASFMNTMKSLNNVYQLSDVKIAMNALLNISNIYRDMRQIGNSLYALETALTWIDYSQNLNFFKLLSTKEITYYKKAFKYNLPIITLYEYLSHNYEYTGDSENSNKYKDLQEQEIINLEKYNEQCANM